MVVIMIKGFEMPRNCCFCPFERRRVCSAIGHPITDGERRPYAKRTGWCPLQEINLTSEEKQG